MCPSPAGIRPSGGPTPWNRFRKGNHPEAKASSLVKPSMPKDSTQLQNSSASKAPLVRRQAGENDGPKKNTCFTSSVKKQIVTSNEKKTCLLVMKYYKLYKSIPYYLSTVAYYIFCHYASFFQILRPNSHDRWGFVWTPSDPNHQYRTSWRPYVLLGNRSLPCRVWFKKVAWVTVSWQNNREKLEGIGNFYLWCVQLWSLKKKGTFANRCFICYIY